MIQIRGICVGSFFYVNHLIFSFENRLLWHGHQVMYNQLASWMVYGVLQDPYSEFFIQR